MTIKWNADAKIEDKTINLDGLMPKKVSELENDAGYATSAYVDSSCNTLSSELTGWVEEKGYLVSDNVDISYDSEEKKITLDLGGGNIKHVDCAAFIKDGMISSVDYDNVSRKLTITWNSDSGKDSNVTEIDLSGLVDVYTAGNGLSVDDNGKFSLTAEIPLSVSELENDAGYATSAYVNEGHGYHFQTNFSVTDLGEGGKAVNLSGVALESDVYVRNILDGCLSAVSGYNSIEEVPLSAVVDSIWCLGMLRAWITKNDEPSK